MATATQARAERNLPPSFRGNNGTLNIHPKLYEIGWNRQALTMVDFVQIAATSGITCVEIEKPDTVGTYNLYDGHPVITLAPSLKGHWKAFVAWHEFAHFLFHIPGQTADEDEAEVEADLLSICAIIPQTLLLSSSLPEIVEMGFPPALVWLRRDFYHRFNL